jgi:WD40 repeat protein/serine/threonine protein kinase
VSADSTGPAWRLKDLSAAEYPRLSELLDSCLALSAEERTDWLSRLESEDVRSAAILRRLFATSDAGGVGTLPETRDVLTRHLTSLFERAETLVGKRVGQYRVLSLLGQGGMGSVWLAERADGLFTRQVALKLVHPVLMGRQVTERFAREREILASFSHPNIARLFDAGFTDEGQPYLALQYVAGRPITAYCDDRQLTLQERLRLFLQVLSAVQYAHAHLIVHRDLKPSNILVTGDGEVQLLDFGIAKLLTAGDTRETELTQLGGRALTPDYAAPEQIAGQPITTGADVYALGVIFHELLTGARPYRLKRDSRGALEEAILQADPVAPSRTALTEAAARARHTTPGKLKKALSGDLDAIAMKALKKLPAQRYPTADAFAEDLTRYLRGEVVLAQRDSAAYRALKFARRHRLGIVVTMALILTLLGGLAATTFEAKLAASQRDAALQSQMRLLTQAAAGRLRDADVHGALGLVLEVLPSGGSQRTYLPEALSVFQEARAADIQTLALAGHSRGRVSSAAFSPDGRSVLTAGFDGTVRIWDGQTGYERLRLMGHTHQVAGAAYSPDGRRVASASFDKTARIWDAETGRELNQLTGHTDWVFTAAFASDARHVVTASADKTARIWDVESGRELVQLKGHTDAIGAASFSPDGQRVVTASDDRTARIWDANTGREIATLVGHPDLVLCASFSPDGRRVVTSSTDKTARIWDVASGRELVRLTGHTDWVFTAAFSRDGRWVVTASADKTARIWDADSGREVDILSGHTGRVVYAAFSPDGRHIATASLDMTARIWDFGMRPDRMQFNGHTEQVLFAAFSGDGRRVITASADKTARIWDVETGREITILRGHSARVIEAAFSNDGRKAVTSSADKTARVWDAATGAELNRLSGHTDEVGSVTFSPDGRQVVTSSADRTVRFWDVATAQERLRLSSEGQVRTAYFSPDGRRIVTSSTDKTARVWDAATGRELLLLGHPDRVICAAFSPDGQRIVTASDDKVARIWDAATGRQLLLLSGHRDRVFSASFSSDGRRIATASADRTVRIWDTASGQMLLVLGDRRAGQLQSARFSPDGRYVITGAEDSNAHLWRTDLASIRTQIAWVAAAQLVALSPAERLEVGLALPADVRQWPASADLCDESAAAPYDPHRRAAGVRQEEMASDVALSSCSRAQHNSRTEPRYIYQHGRALMAKGSLREAQAEFERAAALGYAASRIDLARLLTQPAAPKPDVPRAIALLDQAWGDGVAIAAFELGHLYENGAHGLPPDAVEAWVWYQKGVQVSEPNALARFAEREDLRAVTTSDRASRNAHLLEGFRYFAAAVERARIEAWPDEAWKNWRYRRASLARVLANEGMMEQVAAHYEHIVEQYVPPEGLVRWHLGSTPHR